MKISLLIIFLFCFPAVGLSQPAIHFEKEKHDFGRVTSIERLEYAFEVTNTGTEDLLIDDLIPS